MDVHVVLGSEVSKKRSKWRGFSDNCARWVDGKSLQQDLLHSFGVDS